MTRNGSTRRWRTMRARILRRDPMCQLNLLGCTTVATCVDHIVPVSRGGPMFDPDNLRGACRSCNRQKSDKLDTELARPFVMREW